MTAPIEYGKTDAPARMPRWLALVLFTAATLIAIGTLWALAPGSLGCGEYYPTDEILPGPQPCPEVDGKAFWGFDGLAMLRAYLEGDAFFASGAWEQAAALPAGQTRR